MNSINLRLEILNTLADDGENVQSIMSMLKNLANITADKGEVIQIIYELLADEAIYIRYPPKKQFQDFMNSCGDEVYDFWFEMTDKGREEWSNGESYFDNVDN